MSQPTITTERVLEALSHVDDPDLKKDIVTLGMVRNLVVEGKHVSFTVMLTTPACPMKDLIHRACVNAVKHLVDQEAEVSVTMDAEVTTGKANKPSLQGVKNIVAIASGKGGVGKSTVAANLAVALALSGAKVGLVDADIYGPSIPMLFDVQHEKPLMRSVDGKGMIEPVVSHGVKLLSIGFFAELNQAVVWRGPMAAKALNQLFSDACWGELDYLLVDLPPGTGDIHLSLVQGVPLTGAVVVSTPQDIALADVRKGVSMFRMPNINVPVLGIVENMAYFTPEELPQNKYYIFGQGGARRLAETMEIPFLGEIPLIQGIREGGDLGRPAVMQPGTPQAEAFLRLAAEVARAVAMQNAGMNQPFEPVS
jgi:ATP-binding protein involved in chromosome partitioning